MSANSTTEIRMRRKGPLLVLALVLAGAAGAGAWWYYRAREPVPELPAVDLSNADPEVARAINKALDDVRDKPRDAARWGRLGMTLRAHDFDAVSVQAFRSAGELDPNDYRWPYLEGLSLVLIAPDRGLERLRHAAKLAPAARPEPRLRVAELLFERGDFDAATAIAESLLQTDPGLGRAHLVLARVALAQGDRDAALRHAVRAGEDARTRRSAAMMRGEVYAARGERERADAEFRAVADLQDAPARVDPVVADVEDLRVGVAARLDEATQLVDEGRGMDAISLLEETARGAPNNPAPSLRLGELLIVAGNPRAARDVLEPYVIRFPTSVDGWFNLGVARFQTQDWAKSAEAFREVVKLKPDHALAHFNLGHCHLKLGDRSAAKAAFEEALRCRPDYQPAIDALKELAKNP